MKDLEFKLFMIIVGGLAVLQGFSLILDIQTKRKNMPIQKITYVKVHVYDTVRVVWETSQQEEIEREYIEDTTVKLIVFTDYFFTYFMLIAASLFWYLLYSMRYGNYAKYYTIKDQQCVFWLGLICCGIGLKGLHYLYF